MVTLFTVAGIAVTSILVENALEMTGHADKIVYVRIAAYVTCGFITFEYWWELVRYVKSSFGVM